MALLEEGVHARLTASAGVIALTTTSRVYAQVLPQGCDVPAITVQRISTRHESAMGVDSSLVWARMQISSWAKQQSQAHNLAAAVKGALKRWRGTAAGVAVEETFLLNEHVRYEDERKLHRVIQDFGLWYRD